MDVFPIRTDQDHRLAVQEIERLWDAEAGSDAFRRLQRLAAEVDVYEARRWPLDRQAQSV